MFLHSSARSPTGALRVLVMILLVAMLGLPGPAHAETDLSLAQQPITADTLPTWQTNGAVWALENVDGVVYVGGDFTSVRPPGAASGTGEVARARFAAFDGQTGSLLSCAPSFSGGSGVIRALRASPDGSRLYVGGSFTSAGGASASNFAAFSIPSCSRIAAATFARPAVNSTVRAISATSTNVYLGGDFTTVNSVSRPRYASLTSDGTLTAAQADFSDVTRAILAVPEVGKVFVGGKYETVNGSAVRGLVALDPTTGDVVQTYPGWVPSGSAVQALTRDATNFYVGDEGSGLGVFDGRIAGDLATGAQIWKDRCLGATQTLAVHNGILYSGHHAHDCTFTENGWVDDGFRQHFLAQATDSSAIYSWFPDTDDGIGSAPQGPRALAFSGDVLWAGGEFTQANSKAQRGLVRFSPGPDVGSATVPSLQVDSFSAGQVLVRWQSSWDRDDGELAYDLYRDGILVNTQTMKSREWSRPFLSYVDTVAPGERVSYKLKVRETDGSNPSGFSGTKTVVAAADSNSYAGAVAADQPDLYWRLNDTATQIKYSRIGQPYVTALMWDASGHNVPATSEAGFTDTAPRDPVGYTLGTSGALTDDLGETLDGVNGRLASSFGNDPAPPMTAPSQFSAELWFRTTTTSGGKLMGFGNRRTDSWVRTEPAGTPTWTSGISTVFDRHVYMNNAGKLLFGVDTAGGKTVAQTSATFNDGNWHHVVATLGPTGMHLYVDGVAAATNANTASKSYAGFWRVGQDNLNGWTGVPTSRSFAGDIDEVAIYPGELTPSRVSVHFLAARPGGDILPPSAPSGLVGTPAPGLANLTWTASTDNVAVANYEIHRSATSGFSVSPATLVGTSATTSFTENPVAQGAWYYRVVAVDASGNRSTASAQDQVDVPEPPPPTTIASTVAPSADSFVHQLNAATNYGTDTTLSADGSPILTALMKFPLPTTPTGRVLTAAKLRINTTSASSASSVDAQNVQMAGNNWTESTVTYNNKPTVSPTVIGTLPGNSAVSTAYSIPLDPAALTPILGSDATLAVNSAGGDSFSFWSANKGAPGPQLELTYTLISAIDTTAPSVPGDLTSTATGSAVALNWSASTDEYGVASYAVSRSSSSSFTPSETTELASTDETSYVDPACPPGVWFYRVTAKDGAGNQSQPSGSSQVTVLDTTAPSAPFNLVATPGATSVALTWGAATDDAAVADYLVYRSQTPDFTPGQDNLVATTTNASFEDTGLALGDWYYRVVARDTSGNVSVSSTEITATVRDITAPTAPMDLMATTSSTGVDLGWTQSNDDVGVTGYSVYRSRTGGFTPSQATLIGTPIDNHFSDDLTAAGTYHYLVTAHDAAGNVSATSLEGNVEILDLEKPSQPQGLAATQVGTAANLTWNASSDNVGVVKYSVFRSQDSQFLPTADTLIGTSTTASFSDGAPSLGTWSYRVVAQDAAGNDSDPSEAFTFEVTTPAEPTAPSNLQSTPSGTTVDLGWTGATGGSGGINYVVHRSPTSGFHPSAATERATVSSTTWQDTDVAVGTWYYLVVAVDSAGVSSTPSNQTSATIAAPSVSAVSASADTYVHSLNPSTNYGTSSSLSADDSPDILSYLRFPLPSKPAGKVLTKAYLKVQTTSSASALSLSNFSVRVASDSWSETSMTYANRPAVNGPQLGLLKTPSAISTTYLVPLDITKLAPLLGTSQTIAVTAVGDDAALFWSRSAPLTAGRPQLQLTFQ